MSDVARVDHFPIQRWEVLKARLLKARTIEELNKASVTIDTFHHLSKKSQRNLSIQNEIAETRLRIDRRRGEWLADHISRGGNSNLHKVILRDVQIKNRESVSLQRLAMVPGKVFERYLNACKERSVEITTADALRLIRVSKAQTPPLPRNKFSLIVADPPWPRTFSCPRKVFPGYHYSTMALREICGMGEGIRRVAADNCTLLLWIPAPMLAAFPRVLAAWGFQYRTMWAWDKIKGTWGHYGRDVLEFIVIAGKGRSTPTAPDTIVQRTPTLQSIRKTIHSRKPSEYYRIIERLWPGGKYLELFARPQSRRPGWTIWGAEVPTSISS
jgi:N6-adenosine-specific RNA methylase IME4